MIHGSIPSVPKPDTASRRALEKRVRSASRCLQHITSAHSVVFIGLLPLATAIFGVLRGGERPEPAFWVFAITGAMAVAGFALAQSGGASLTGGLLMILAVVLCGWVMPRERPCRAGSGAGR